MSKYIVVTFADEARAYKGLSAFRELHNEGSITLYGTLVVQRQADGKLAIKQRTAEEAIGAGVGSLFGALVGAFGGPVGMAAGLVAGGAAGGATGAFEGEVSEEFIQDVGRDLTPGMYAVLAEASEGWTTPVDTRMEVLGGKVIREEQGDVVEAILDRRVEAQRASFEQKKAAFRSHKVEKMEARVEKEITEAREKLQRTAEKARRRLDETETELNIKLQTLEEQATKAKPETKQQIDARVAEIRKELGERQAKLAHAWDIAREALRP